MAEQRTTSASGVPVAGDEHSLPVGPNGPTVLQDAYVVQKMQHFSRERVPERLMHAKGSAMPQQDDGTPVGEHPLERSAS